MAIWCSLGSRPRPGDGTTESQAEAWGEDCHAKIVPGENCTGRYIFGYQICTAPVHFWSPKVYRPDTILITKSVPRSCQKFAVLSTNFLMAMFL